MMHKDIRPAHVKKRLPGSLAPLVNGKALISAARAHNAMIMACNIRCKLPVEGIVLASLATGAPVMYELAKSELSYTEWSPETFVDYIVAENERLGNASVPFAVHADHTTVKKPEEVEPVKALLARYVSAGYTSFSIDASHMENDLNLSATGELSRPLQDLNLCLEVELGEIGAKSGSSEGFTQPEEAEWFIRALKEKGIHPDLLAINNGSIHGTYFGSSQEGIQLDLTREIWKVVHPYGVDIAQHGITGTSLEKITQFINYGIRKGNVGTFWQNISFGLGMSPSGNAITNEAREYLKRSYRGVPDDLWAEMWAWAVETGNTGGNIKSANKVFAPKFNMLPCEYKRRVTEHARDEAIRLFEATNSVGLAGAAWEAAEKLA